MFTGLVEALGWIEGFVDERGGRRLTVCWPGLVEGLAVGESVAVNGCCLTVVGSAGERFEVQAGPETLARTNLGERAAGDRVNLERALRVGDRLGGHFVQGHIDGTAELRERREEGEWEYQRYAVDERWTRLMVEKGSIAVDGVSLTLVTVERDGFSVMLIPHTLAVTTLGWNRPGMRVNIETDLLAKHVAKLLGAVEGADGALAGVDGSGGGAVRFGSVEAGG
ncbi:MAG: riboflavin synthase subunit alpha [Isosphaeraceae bacterium]|jgi:riboflavin synthase|nr:MAG: riboflavin synthase subunit alpha [Isosphaeraceae bacterium]